MIITIKTYSQSSVFCCDNKGDKSTIGDVGDEVFIDFWCCCIDSDGHTSQWFAVKYTFNSLIINYNTYNTVINDTISIEFYVYWDSKAINVER